MTTNAASARRVGGWPATVWTVVGLVLVMDALAIWWDFRTGLVATGAITTAESAVSLGTQVAFLISGAVIVSRQPKNIIGWLLMTPGLILPVDGLVNTWLLALDPPPVSADLLVWLGVWLVSWSWVILIFPIFHLLITFPDGRLLSRRWRWVVLVEAVMVTLMMFIAAFGGRLAVTDELDREIWSVANPIGFIPESFGEESAFWLVWTAGLIGLAVAGLVAMFKRFRAGSQLERQQLKWPLYAIALFGLVYAWGALFDTWSESDPGILFGILFWPTIAAIPASVAVAVLRYRLYELERIVSRTVTYLIVAALLVSAYGLLVLTLGSLFGRNNPVAVAGATLAAAALFNPLRTRIRRWVDRRFNRSRYDAEGVVDEFTSTLRDVVEPQDVVDGLVGVLSETVQPATFAIWIRTG